MMTHILADPQYTDWKLEHVAKALNKMARDTDEYGKDEPTAMYEIISDLHSAVMGLMREVRSR